MAAVEEIVWQDSARDAWQDVRLPVAGQGKESADGVVEGLMAPSSGKARGILLPENWLLAWRIQDGCPQTLEVQEASIYQAASFSGARIHFPDALHHVGLKTSASGVILAALLPSGLLYTATLPTGPVGRALERLSPSSFRSHSLAAPLSRLGGATHLAVTTSHVLVGTKSGTLLTCALQTEQEVVGELKDADRVLGRLWRGLVSG